MVNAAVLEIFQQHLVSKALVLVNATVLEIFQRDLLAKALVLVNATVLEIFQRGLCHVHLIFDVLKLAAKLEVFVKLLMFIYFSADHPHSE